MASFSWTLVVVLSLLYLSLSNATTCTEPYSCESTCYRYSAYKAVCGNRECYKSRLEPYICNETCYKKVCCQGYTGDDCQTPLCFGATTCPNGGRCVNPDTCVCLPGYFGPQCGSCGLLPNINNGQFKLHTSGPIGNAVARLECSSGYVQVPDSNQQFELHCDDTGHWSPDDHNVTCQLKDCGDPDKYVAHGRYVVLQGTTFGNQAVLQCDDGFGSATLASISCLETGAWSDSTEAICTRVFPAVQTSCGTDTCTDPLSYCNPILKKCKCVEGYNMNDDGICEKGCPSSDWVQFGDNCYYFGKVELQYQQARNFCDLYDSGVQESSLVQVDTVEELKFLKSYMLSRSIVPIYGYWNDVFQNTTNGVDEYWRTSGDPLVVTDWGPSEPNLQSESCNMFYKPYDYKWADVPCANSERPDEINDIFTAFVVCETKTGAL